MEIKVYLHRTKKKNFAVCEAFIVDIDMNVVAEKGVDYINRYFKNKALQLAFSTVSVKKYGTGYISFMRPQYEGPAKENGNDTIYFDNTEMLFKLKEGQKT